MKKTKTVAFAALIAVLSLGSNALLGSDYSPGTLDKATDKSDRHSSDRQQMRSEGSAAQPMKINKGSVLIGSTVKNQQGETLGKIHDVVIDFNADKVAYVVLATGTAVLGSQKLHAVPLRAFQPDAEGTGLILNADKEKLAQSEGFDKNNWPALGTTTFGAEPFWKDDQGSSGSQQDLNQQSKDYKRQQKETSKEIPHVDPTQPQP